MPPIADVARRERCRASLRLFCETYNPEAFTLGWSADHLRGFERIEEAATLGALYALAWPRGSGKTTICRMAMLWALSYRHRRYGFLIGANASKAEDSLEAVKVFIRFLPDYAADFPEVAHAVRALGGIAQRAVGQLCGGAPTMVEWSKDRIVLPTVPPPPNWPKAWPLRSDGMAPTSGSILGVSGLTGDGIRGSLLTLTTGATVRPDFVLLDDPQTDESAASPAQNASRERLIAGAVLGMAGPGKSISAVMPCTVIQAGDMADRMLDRSKHPLWRGERCRLLPSMPSDLAAWDRYFEVYERCQQLEPPDLAEANAYYEAHRAGLDAGAVPSWPDRKLDTEVSAVQHAMNLYCRDRAAFWSEYQNAPLELDARSGEELTAGLVAGRLSGHRRGLAPSRATRLTAFVDVQQAVLFWAVCAWEENFTGTVLDYGTWPKQERSHFTLRDVRRTLAVAYKGQGLEAQLAAGLTDLADELLGRDWHADGGGVLRVDRQLVDSGWQSEVVERWCRASPHRDRVGPSKGRGISASGNPIADWPKRPGERRGPNWIVPAARAGHATRLLIYDTNAWKSFTAARLLAPAAAAGGLTLFGDREDAHRLFAEHAAAEYRVRTTGRGRSVDEWKCPPGRDNHWWDCLVGCAVAASYLGVRLAEASGDAPKRKRKLRDFSEEQKAAQARRAAREGPGDPEDTTW